MRSSATAEDLPNVSFAGQHESYLNIYGDELLIDSWKRCFASLFTDRAIHYRIDQGFDHFKVYLSIAVMKMVRSDLAASGVIFSLDTESGFRDVVFITGAYGLGENVVQGAVDPDEFYVFKPTLEQGYRISRGACSEIKKSRWFTAKEGPVKPPTTFLHPKLTASISVSPTKRDSLGRLRGKSRKALHAENGTSFADGYGYGQKMAKMDSFTWSKHDPKL